MHLTRFIIVIALFSLITVGKAVEIVPADPASGFSWPYILQVPDNIGTDKQLVMIVETNNTGAIDAFEQILQKSTEQASGNGIGPMLAKYMEQPFLMPVFPRTRKNWQLYTHALDRDTLLVESGNLKRIDLQVLAMVEDARSKLNEKDIPVDEKFIICGFSASGSFANRFAFLHPDKLLAVVAGGINAFPMLPIEQSGKDSLNFPLGTADLETITGNPFNLEAWKALPQMLFMGALDDNDAVLYDDAYSSKERELIFRHVGEDMHQRWFRAQQICLKLQPKIKFITYGHAGHWTDREIGMDIVNFVNESAAGKF